ncbi:META domain protein [Rubripirellula lacrimiformis]|uniref:Altered inheritance of mitochondria protein 6 n=1 Tax=Rubripirellula lacrimiformis TaxID=1930273 RepID=A0A517NGP1_9BACT|nr:META domain-containing protein [Rubripirellula lacrimiformis]QDT06300.1 META domain protein [Rubripirellula lacrimiformis]
MIIFRTMLAVACLASVAQAQQPLLRAHAHNDYEHDRPLLDALDQGFCSVEADVYLVDGKLLVAHDRKDLRPDRTLSALYLDPLRKRVQDNDGHVYPVKTPFYLMIDFKSEAESTYAALDQVLSGYDEMISVVRDGKLHPKAIQVIVSGNRPSETMASQSVRYAGYDGRISDLESNAPDHLMPMISDNWKNHFQWRGKGEFGDDEQQKLTSIIEKVHAAGRRVRFWATPDHVDMWRMLNQVGADAINTDDLAGLATFLRESETATDSADAPAQATIIGKWLVEDIEQHGVIDRAQTTIEFAKDGTVTGSTCVNRYNAKATVDGSDLTFQPMAMTRRAGPRSMMDQESRFVAAIGKVKSFRIDPNGLLYLVGGDGKDLLRCSSMQR